MVRNLFRYGLKIRELVRPGQDRKELVQLLSHVKDVQTAEARALWLENILDWIRLPLATSTDKTDASFQAARVRFILIWLDRNTELKSQVARLCYLFLAEGKYLELFSQTSLGQERGFLSELARRLSLRFIPRPYDTNELSDFLSLAFHSVSDGEWVRDISAETVANLWALVGSGRLTSEPLVETLVEDALKDTVTVLSVRVAALGLNSSTRVLFPDGAVHDSPFFLLADTLRELSPPAVANRPQVEAFFEQIKLAEDLILQCRSDIEFAHKRLETSGVSVEIVFQLEVLSQLLQRLELVLNLLFPSSMPQKTFQDFLAELIVQIVTQHEVISLFETNLNLLSQKIVERTGETGEHYITRDRAEYKDMLKSAAGGGFLTVGTVLIKFLTARLSLSLLFEGVFSWMNYSISFVSMQLLHFTLATKQPSMTAAALAGKLKELRAQSQVDDFVDEVARITRSQFAAAIGNLGAVIIGALVFEGLFFLIFRKHVVQAEYAEHFLDSLSPITSGTIFYATLTGVLLWVSSLVAGWLDNWLVFRRVPEGISQSRRLQAVLGNNGTLRVSHFVRKQLAAMGGNVTLGFCLAFTGIVGKFVGIAFDVRHVTLSTGALTFSTCALLGGHLSAWTLLWAIAGILVIGVLNFGVSFALSLAIAIRARRVKRIWVRLLFVSIGREFLRRPGFFLFAPKETPMAPVPEKYTGAGI